MFTTSSWREREREGERGEKERGGKRKRDFMLSRSAFPLLLVVCLMNYHRQSSALSSKLQPTK